MKHLIARVRAFLLGVREFRTDFTTHFEDEGLLEVYDLGREMAHRATFRRFDQTA